MEWTDNHRVTRLRGWKCDVEFNNHNSYSCNFISPPCRLHLVSQLQRPHKAQILVEHFQRHSELIRLQQRANLEQAHDEHHESKLMTRSIVDSCRITKTLNEVRFQLDNGICRYQIATILLKTLRHELVPSLICGIAESLRLIDWRRQLDKFLQMIEQFQQLFDARRDETFRWVWLCCDALADGLNEVVEFMVGFTVEPFLNVHWTLHLLAGRFEVVLRCVIGHFKWDSTLFFTNLFFCFLFFCFLQCFDYFFYTFVSTQRLTGCVGLTQLYGISNCESTACRHVTYRNHFQNREKKVIDDFPSRGEFEWFMWCLFSFMFWLSAVVACGVRRLVLAVLA